MKKFIILMSVFSISACDKLSTTKSNEENKKSNIEVSSSTQTLKATVNTVTNPCLDKNLIQSVKQGIIDRANEIITTKESQDFSYLTYPLIQNTAITFSNISEPTKFMGKDNVCEASVTIEYVGDSETPASTVQQMVKFLEKDLPYSTDPLAQIFNGQAYQKQLQKFGLNQYNLDGIRSINGNVFETSVQYIPTKTYNEAGEAQQGWTANFGEMPSVIATTAAYDILIRNLNKRTNNSSDVAKAPPQPVEPMEEPDSIEMPLSKKSSNRTEAQESNDLAEKQQEWEEEQSRKADELDKDLQKQLEESSQNDSKITIK